MKKLFTTLAALSVISATGSAAAATYQGTSTYTGSGWAITWPATEPKCGNLDFYNASPLSTMIIVVDGNVADIGAISTIVEHPNKYTTRYIFNNLPDGNQFSATSNGNSFFVCGADTYLLPGQTPPPTAVPTMSEWAMILLGMMLAGAAALTIHRRRMAA